ncbi:LptA/OstA family protein [Acetobacteraceae bacterium KSS8]|uniref:LptA/OstA family protein n=1 Tax=Endosaccharibacter trunci TaxID=2812733 RepID=A0ABT1W997_9PROT|nr:LptA/OstA family protein [Acetobacteraceae bacterium KSS8]
MIPIFRAGRWAPLGVLGIVAACLLPHPAAAQQIDLSHGGQVTVTALGGFDWDQKAQTVTAFKDAQAVRGGVTVTADKLIAYYRKKATAPGKATPAAQPAPTGTKTDSVAPTPENPTGAPKDGVPGDDSGSNEIYRLEAVGHVHIFTATQQAFGDHALYDMDKGVMVMTGHDLHMITPQDLLTARDQMEYWPNLRMSVGRGDATVTTNDGRKIKADVLVGYSAPPAATPAGAAKPATPANGQTTNGQTATVPGQDPIGSTGKLEKVNAFGNVVVRTATETIRGDRGVYVPDTGIARIVGNVHITRGPNQLNGAAAIVNMKTGIATMTEDPGARVQGLIVPNDSGGANRGPQAGGKTPK